MVTELLLHSHSKSLTTSFWGSAALNLQQWWRMNIGCCFIPTVWSSLSVPHSLLGLTFPHLLFSLFSLFILSFDFTTHCSGFLFFYMLFSLLSLFILSFALWFHRPTHWQLFTQFLQHSSDHCSGFLTLLSALPRS